MKNTLFIVTVLFAIACTGSKRNNKPEKEVKNTVEVIFGDDFTRVHDLIGKYVYVRIPDTEDTPARITDVKFYRDIEGNLYVGLLEAVIEGIDTLKGIRIDHQEYAEEQGYKPLDSLVNFTYLLPDSSVFLKVDRMTFRTVSSGESEFVTFSSVKGKDLISGKPVTSIMPVGILCLDLLTFTCLNTGCSPTKCAVKKRDYWIDDCYCTQSYGFCNWFPILKCRQVLCSSPCRIRNIIGCSCF
jgi:hypothetical protein